MNPGKDMKDNSFQTLITSIGALWSQKEGSQTWCEPLIVLALLSSSSFQATVQGGGTPVILDVSLSREDRDQSFGRPRSIGNYTKTKDRALG